MNRELIIYTHGNLGQSLVDAVALIYGDEIREVVKAYSNEEHSIESAFNFFSDLIDPEKEYIFVTDFPGGSCFMVSRKLVQKKENMKVVTGLNMPLVFGFLSCKDLDLPLNEIAKKVVGLATEAIM